MGSDIFFKYIYHFYSLKSVDLLRLFVCKLIVLQFSPGENQKQFEGSCGWRYILMAGNQIEHWLSFKIVSLINRMKLA